MLGLCRRAPERILFCGWRRDMHDMIAVLDAFVYPGSELWLYNEVSLRHQALFSNLVGSRKRCVRTVVVEYLATTFLNTSRD